MTITARQRATPKIDPRVSGTAGSRARRCRRRVRRHRATAPGPRWSLGNRGASPCPNSLGGCSGPIRGRVGHSDMILAGRSAVAASCGRQSPGQNRRQSRQDQGPGARSIAVLPAVSRLLPSAAPTVEPRCIAAIWYETISIARSGRSAVSACWRVGTLTQPAAPHTAGRSARRSGAGSAALSRRPRSAGSGAGRAAVSDRAGPVVRRRARSR